MNDDIEAVERFWRFARENSKRDAHIPDWKKPFLAGYNLPPKPPSPTEFHDSMDENLEHPATGE